MISGYERCNMCGEEFYFSIMPKDGVFITCPNYDTTQPACSLCDNSLVNCSDDCRLNILKSLEDRGIHYEL